MYAEVFHVEHFLTILPGAPPTTRILQRQVRSHPGYLYRGRRRHQDEETEEMCKVFHVEHFLTIPPGQPRQQREFSSDKCVPIPGYLYRSRRWSPRCGTEEMRSVPRGTYLADRDTLPQVCVGVIEAV